MGVGAERPKTWGGSSQKLGRIDHVWGGCGVNQLWGRSTGTHWEDRASGFAVVTKLSYNEAFTPESLKF